MLMTGCQARLLEHEFENIHLFKKEHPHETRIQADLR